MAISKMLKISLTGLNQDKDKILEILQDVSYVQIIDPDKNELKKILSTDLFFEGSQELEYDISELKFAIDLLQKYDVKNKPSMIQSFMGDLPEISSKEYNENSKIDYQIIINDLKNIELKLTEIDRQQEIISQNISILRDWTHLNIIPKRLSELTNYSFHIGSINLDHWHEFSRQLKKTTNLYALYTIESNDNNSKDKKFIIFYSAEEEIVKKINTILNQFSFNPNEYIEALDMLPQKKLSNQKTLFTKLLNEKKTLISNINNYLSKKTALMCIYEKLNWRDDLLKTKQKTIQTNDTFTLFFWIKENNIKKLEKRVSQYTKYIHFLDHDINKNEEPPVELENNDFIKPFEAVTNIYGMPKYSEPDPTTWLAPFFIIFFALCLTDAGYGIAIVIVTYIMLKKWNFILIRLLNYAGWATIVIGALTGGWFGIELNNISIPWLRDILTSIRLIDPIKNPIVMMLIALGLGIIQIWVGIACRAYWNFKNNKAKEALLDQFPWLYLLLVIIGYALTSTGAITILSISTWLTLLYIGLAIIIITQSRDQKNIFLKPFTGAIKLYDVIGFLSDTLSYARLLALGLATAIIAFVINIIAELTKGIPYVGILLFILILIGGHLFNLGINLLGSFIHSARLQYVEFFSKFMEGGGTRFKPFSKKSTYIKIK